MEYKTFHRLSIVTVLGLAAVMIVFFRDFLFAVMLGIELLWIGIIIALVSKFGAIILTKRAIAIGGIQVERNPAAREMFARGNLTPYYRSVSLIAGIGVVLTVISAVTDILPFGLLIVVYAVALWFWLDLANDAYQMYSYKKRHPAG